MRSDFGWSTGLKVIGWCGLILILVGGCGELKETELPGAGVQAEGSAALTDSTGKPLGSIARQIVAQNTAADRDMNLLARLEVQDGELLEFYELAPGRILVSGAGAPTAAIKFSADEAPFSAEAYRKLWTAAAGPATMPSLLQAAVERVGSRSALAGNRQRKLDAKVRLVPQTPAVDIRPVSRISSNGLEVNQSAVTGGWCQTNYYTQGISGNWQGKPLGYCSTESFWTKSYCWDNVTGNAGVAYSDAGFLLSNVCPYRGQVLYKVEADEDWISTGSWTVAEDHYRWIRIYDSGCDIGFDDCPWIKTSVANASGDGYNYRYLANDP